MRYCMKIVDVNFAILSKNKENALKSVKLSIDEMKIRNAKTIEEILIAWRWVPKIDKNGNIIGIHFEGGEFNDDDMLFNIIAPYVVSGNYIQMQGEDRANWKWVFKNSKCIQQGHKFLTDENFLQSPTKCRQGV